MAGVPKPKLARCEDCYFQQNMLCALNLDKPCPTYRPAERGLGPSGSSHSCSAPSARTAAYAFPQPQGARSPLATRAVNLRRMRLTVLGKSPSWQDAGGACSGYLIEEGGDRVVLDCGNGVFSKLRRSATTTTSTRS